MEEWKSIIGLEGRYSISSLGNVRNDRTGKLLKLSINEQGYYRVCLNRKTALVHRLVGFAFVEGYSEERCHIDHINTIRTDNRVENLRWVTRTENMNNPLTKEKIRNSMVGENNPFYGKKHTEETRNKIRQKHWSKWELIDGKRVCY